ncbi:DnaJ domain containing protein [Reticulomyxa filosa]|uniref:DnaJ domain containing protein n=1 Tax=Reticulomyxa filosa TaxID=46433 RepID=X6MNP0_RETFI|nr:DnaJ domain containing protein [Reticulomyxa filosa]|eukprot:ETO15618.1 DnaJ domain containing protein [Reticulomyxa filosa]
MTDFDDSIHDWKPGFDPYVVLNVPRDCTREQVLESYKKLSRTFHPDKQTNASYRDVYNAFEEQQNDTAQMDSPKAVQERVPSATTSDEFIKITKAKDILLDDHLRKAYDKFGMLGVDKLSRTDENHAEVRSWIIGKKYRDDKVVSDLLTYYLNRELNIFV